jgi:hypothetical protein
MGYFYDDPSDHPDALTLEIAGKEVPWLLNKSALSEAASEGIDFSEFEELAEDDVEGNLDALECLIYAGTLPFNGDVDTPTRDEIAGVITPRIAADVAPQVMRQFEGITDEEIEAAVGKE